jgi:DNA adenine methylase
MQQALASRQESASPFLRWAGGKSQLLLELDAHIPRFQRYYEPFLGGGALFFHLASSRPAFAAHLSDSNSELVNAYRVVKYNVGGLIGKLRKHEMAYARNPKTFYYWLRAEKPRARLDRAARLVALNKTCYNGLYRVNSAGEFNVPIGSYKNPVMCNAEQLSNASRALKKTKASIRASGYAGALSKASKGDFVYLDPPFVPLSKTSSFVSYTQGGFSLEDQANLADLFRKLDGRGCRVLLSNSNTNLARELYSGYEQFQIRASRAISCKGDGRAGCMELLVRNYDPKM